MYFKSGSSVVMTDNDLNETIQEIVLTKTWIAFTTKWISLSRELVYNTTWRSIFDDMSYSQVSNRRHTPSSPLPPPQPPARLLIFRKFPPPFIKFRKMF